MHSKTAPFAVVRAKEGDLVIHFADLSKQFPGAAEALDILSHGSLVEDPEEFDMVESVRFVNGVPFRFFHDGRILGPKKRYTSDDATAVSAETNFIGNPKESILGDIAVFGMDEGGATRGLTRSEIEDLTYYVNQGQIVYRLTGKAKR